MKFGNRQDGTPTPAQKSSGTSGEITAFIGEGTEIQGDLMFKQTVRVDGTVRATIKSEGELVLGPKGTIEGDVTVNSMSVSGRMKGNLRVKTRLEIHPGGKVEGEVLLGRPGLVVHDGGIMEAKVQMGTLREEVSQTSSEKESQKNEKRAVAAAGAV